MKIGRKTKKVFIRTLFTMLALIMVIVVVGCGPDTPDPGPDPSPDPSPDPGPPGEVYPDPNKEFFIVVPYNPGGSGDVIARVLAPYLSQELGGIPVVVENIPGAGGAVGVMATKRAPSDGYRIVGWHDPGPTIRSLTMEADYTVEDFVGLGVINADVYAIGVRTDSHFENIQQYMDYLVANPEGISIASTGPYGTAMLGIWLVEDAYNTKFNYIPFDGFSPSIQNVLGGHIDSAFLGVDGMTPFIDEGSIRLLAVCHHERLPHHPDVPTFTELAGVPINVASTRGHVIMSDTPPDRLEILREAYYRAANNPQFIADFERRYQHIYYTWQEQEEMVQGFKAVTLEILAQEQAGN